MGWRLDRRIERPQRERVETTSGKESCYEWGCAQESPVDRVFSFLLVNSAMYCRGVQLGLLWTKTFRVSDELLALHDGFPVRKRLSWLSAVFVSGCKSLSPSLMFA